MRYVSSRIPFSNPSFACCQETKLPLIDSDDAKTIVDTMAYKVSCNSSTSIVTDHLFSHHLIISILTPPRQ